MLDKDLPTSLSELSTAYQINTKTDLALPLFQALVLSGKPADAEKLAHEVIARDKTFEARCTTLLYAQYMRTGRQMEAECSC